MGLLICCRSGWRSAAFGLLAILLAVALAPSPTSAAGRGGPQRRAQGNSGTASPDAPAARPYTFDSRYYTITTNLDRDRIREIAQYMDVVYAEYASRFANFRRNVRSGIKENQRMPLYVMRTYDDYLELLNGLGVNGANTGGVYFRRPGGASGLATWVEGQSRGGRNHVLQHEGFHQFADAKISSILPPWVNEGLAEYFGHAVMVRGRLQIGRVDGQHLVRIQQAIRDNSYLNFRELLTMDGRQWGERVNSGDRQSGVMYDMAWSVVHFLVHGGRGRYQPALEKYLDIMNRGSDAKVAFDQVFGKDVGAFEAAWARETAQMRPDPWATSVGQLERVAQVLRLLHKAGAKIDSVEDLSREVERRGIRMSSAPAAHGGNETRRAPAKKKKDDDDDAAADKPAEPEQPESLLAFPAPAVAEVVPSTDDKLPPGMTVKKVSPEILLTWRLDKAGEPQPEIEFKR